ncbi:MAG: HAMP domain-containing histidine kinase, partial [Bdellovibrionaceae bacterium]|nr:HAMP domain-containing histidine kinase [Pseudobdellovibrionaceae bacterium]
MKWITSNFQKYLVKLNASGIEKYFRSAILIFFLTTFYIFRSIGISENKKVSNNISAVLRNELSVSNSYALSKVLVDLENLGVFRCARLTEQSDSQRVFYDTVLGKRCNSFVANNLLSHVSYLKGLNGVSYNLYYISDLNGYALALEVIVYLGLLGLWFILPNLYASIIAKEKIKNAALEYEKEFISDLTKQVSHDVASPLSAIRIMTSLLHNVDPEIKEILNKSISRTQEIFDELKLNSDRTFDKVDVLDCIFEISREKKIVWPGFAEIETVYDQPVPLVNASKVQLKKIFSNLLNNSFEALEDERTGSIRIEVNSVNDDYVTVTIIDNGRGIPSSILQNIGTKNFSFGKENSSNSGRG